MNYFKKVFINILHNIHLAIISASLIMLWRWFDYGFEKNIDTIKPIIEGVVGGVITSLFLLIFSKLWQGNIIPWVENLIYGDTRIEGSWQGVLVPHIGIEQIDRLRMQAAFRAIMESSKIQKNDFTSMPIEATADDSAGEKQPTQAELIIPAANSGASGEKSESKRNHTISIGIVVSPIKVKLEIKRTGHSIEGRLFEMGGASQIHTYFVTGSFKNLILSGTYENENKCHIDRGSFSLMLRRNGDLFDGYFSSYADKEHKIHPFRCFLERTPSQKLSI